MVLSWYNLVDFAGFDNLNLMILDSLCFAGIGGFFFFFLIDNEKFY